MGSIRGKDRRPNEVVYGAFVPFRLTVTLSATEVNTNIADAVSLPLNMKFIRVEATPNASIAGTCSFNFVLGVGAEAGTVPPNDTSGIGYPATVATAGQSFWAADQVLTPTANLTQRFTPTNPNAVWPVDGFLTLRIVTNGSGAGVVYFTLLGIPFDNQPTVPGLTSLNLATDL